MSERFISDEEIHQASGNAPRVPPGVPRATCLNCGHEYHAFYAAQAHDCRIDLKATKTYAEWLLIFQRFGYGVLKDPSARKFPKFSKVISGRTALTFQLQSDLYFASTHPVTDDRWYTEPDEWKELEFYAVPSEVA